MSRALDATIERLRQPEFDARVLRNMLVFHGVGGVGKSTLSERLEQWIRGHLPDHNEWSDPPLEGRVRTARANFVAHQGELNVPAILIAIRAGMTTRTQKWPAFDLALAAYLAATRPGQNIATTTAADQTEDVLDVLSGLAQDLGAMDVVTSFSAVAVGKVLRLAMKKINEHEQLRRFGGLLKEILNACARISIGDNAPDVGAEILWLLTEEVEAKPVTERPVMAIFLDHMEKLPKGGSAERALNQLVANLPWALFVVTGRNRLDWHLDRDGLPFSGAATWPQLAGGSEDEPRQHLVGHLSPSDTERLLRWRRHGGGWRMSDELLNKLVVQTRGWPLHIDAVCQVATNRTLADGRHLTEGDLLGELRDLVARIFEDLDADEKRVFNAACLLPHFDAVLVAAIAGTTVGAADRCIGRTIVDANPDSAYPFRVHEEVRRLVRLTGSGVPGGWSARDWADAARRGLAELRERHQSASMEADNAERANRPRNDAPILDALALGLTLGAVEDVYDPWLAEAVRTSPSIRGLATRLAAPTPDQTHRDSAGFIELSHALSLPMKDAPTVLEGLFKRRVAASQSAGLWLAYRLRTLGRFDEAIGQLERLLGDFPDRERLYRNQISITMRQQRRFQDALDYREANGLPDSDRFQATSYGHHGQFHYSVDIFTTYSAKQTSARFRLETETNLLARLVRQGVDCREHAGELLARSTNLGEPAFEKNCLFALGLHSLGSHKAFEDIVLEVQIRNDKTSSKNSKISELLALRAMYTRRPEDVRRAIETARRESGSRSAAWIGAEIFLEELGHRLDPVDGAQWLIPYDQVRKNWLDVAAGLLERAAAYARE